MRVHLNWSDSTTGEVLYVLSVCLAESLDNVGLCQCAGENKKEGEREGERICDIQNGRGYLCSHLIGGAEKKGEDHATDITHMLRQAAIKRKTSFWPRLHFPSTTTTIATTAYGKNQNIIKPHV